MSFKTIWDAIFTELDKVRTIDLTAWSVYNYEPKIIENYPAILITTANWDEEILDTITNETTYNFTIRTVDEIHTWIATVEDNMRTLADTVLERLKDVSTSISYSNGCTVKMEYSYEWWWTDTQEPLRVFEITAKYTWLESK